MEYMIKELPEDERPRERLKKYGISALSDIELLAIIIRCGTKNKNAIDIAREILVNYNLNDLVHISLNKIASINGIGEAKGITILASLELGRRSLITTDLNKVQVKSSMDVYNLYYKDMCYLKQEKLLAIFLDTNKYIISSKVILIGTVNASTVHPRDIFREAIDVNAVSIIIMHNHPTGEVEPSYNDDVFTNKLVSLGKMLGIEVIDHLIIGNNRYYSYNEKWNGMHG